MIHKLFMNIGQERQSVYGGREPGTGSIAQIIDDVKAVADLGFDELVIRYLGTDATAQTEQLSQFVDEVAHKV